MSCEDTNIKRTACNALLQMLNTVIKRVTVTQFQLTSHQSLQRSETFEEQTNTSPMKQSIQSPKESEITPDPGDDRQTPEETGIDQFCQ